MPKGKKFDAAQVHFQKKEIIYRQQVRDAETTAHAATERADSMSLENSELSKQVSQLQAQVDYLLQKGGSCIEELKTAMQRDSQLASVYSMLIGMGRTSNPFPHFPVMHKTLAPFSMTRDLDSPNVYTVNGELVELKVGHLHRILFNVTPENDTSYAGRDRAVVLSPLVYENKAVDNFLVLAFNQAGLPTIIDTRDLLELTPLDGPCEIDWNFRG